MTTFAGKYGSLDIPIVEQKDDGFIGEPGLRILGAYLKAYLNFYGKEYSSVAWDEKEVVRYVFGHNPREHGEGSFSGDQLPALFIYRIGSKEIYDMAEDERVMSSEIMCLWVNPHDDPTNLAVRYPFVGAIAKMVDTAIERRRDACFVLEEDTDARKSWRGTHVGRAAGFDSISFKEFRRSELEILDNESDGSWRYMAFDMILEITERVKRDNTEMYPNLNGLDLRVSEDVSLDTVPEYPETLRRIL